jgi:phytoene dehydrogenase-like protein
VARRDLGSADAVVVGAGPNGLAAALTLARAGFKVTVLEAADEPGGGTRTYEDAAVPGLLHDHCSAVHPFGVASPFLRSLPLERFGLTWAHPEVAVAHPLDDGTAPSILRDLDATVAGLGEDGPAWDRLYRRITARFDEVAGDLLRPILRVPRHPFATALAGVPSLLPAAVLAKAFPTPRGRALFGGLAAHTISPLGRPLTSAIALLMGAAGHAYGWPVAVGGSASIWRAMVAMLEDLGGEVVTGVHVRSIADLPRARVALLDVTPTQLAHIAGDHLPAAGRRRAGRWTYGPAATKVDFAVRGEVPWTAEVARRAGTVHLVGALEELVRSEAEVHRGILSPRPFVLVAQPHVADPGREVDGIVPLWAYAHVPHGTTEDASPLIEAQIERFAPGFGERVVARTVTHPADFEAANPNLHGGDITGGASNPVQLIARPRLAVDPYATGIPGMYLCSSSTPPGAGVHGLCGHHAARSALRVLTA